MKKLRFLISLPTSKNDFQLAQASSAEQMGQKRAIDLEIVYADITMQLLPKYASSVSDPDSCRSKTRRLRWRCRRSG